MSGLPEPFQAVVDRFVTWAEAQPDIRAAQLQGSWARGQGDPQWSDLDIEFFTTRPLSYRRSTAWINQIAPLWMAAPDDDGTLIRRWDARLAAYWVWFTTLDGGIAVDFVISAQRVLVWRDLTRRFRRRSPVNHDTILLDKDGRLARVGGVPWRESSQPALPDAERFEWVVFQFWGAADRAVRKLGRGDLYEAKTITDNELKKHLFMVIEWHAAARGVQVPYRRRYPETWADPRAAAALSQIYAHYDPADVARALRATCDLFGWLAPETAARLTLAFPTEQVAHIDAWIKSALARIDVASDEG